MDSPAHGSRSPRCSLLSGLCAPHPSARRGRLGALHLGGPFTAARDRWRMPGVSVVGQSRRRPIHRGTRRMAYAWRVGGGAISAAHRGRIGGVERGSWCGEGDDVEQGGRALMCTASRVWVTRTLLRRGWQWGGCECHGQDPTVTGCSMGSFRRETTCRAGRVRVSSASRVG